MIQIFHISLFLRELYRRWKIYCKIRLQTFFFFFLIWNLSDIVLAWCVYMCAYMSVYYYLLFHFFCFKTKIKETQIDDRNCLRNHVNSGKRKRKMVKTCTQNGEEEKRRRKKVHCQHTNVVWFELGLYLMAVHWKFFKPGQYKRERARETRLRARVTVTELLCVRQMT